MIILYIIGFIINYKLLGNFELNTKALLSVALIYAVLSAIISLVFSKKKIISAIYSFLIEGTVIIVLLKLEELFILGLNQLAKQNHYGLIDILIDLLIIIIFFISPLIFYRSLLIPMTFWETDESDTISKDKKFNMNNIKSELNKKKSLLEKNINNKINFNHLDERKNIESFEKDILYFYDENLNVFNREAVFIWLDNEEKDIFLRNLINELCEELNINRAGNKIQFQTLMNFNPFQEIMRFNPSNSELGLLKSNYEYTTYLNKCERMKTEFIKLSIARFNYYIEQYNSAIRGKNGELYVNSHLDLYDNFYNLSNVRLEIEDTLGEKQSIENDNIVISKYGVYILEVKNYSPDGKYEIIIERDGKWVKKYKNGTTVSMKNATEQNNRHIIYLNKLINSTLHRKMDNYIEIEGIVIIANDTVNIHNNSENEKIFRLAEFYPFLKNQNVTLNLKNLCRAQVFFDIIELITMIRFRWR